MPLDRWPRTTAILVALALVASSLAVVAVFATSAGAASLAFLPGGGAAPAPAVNYQVTFSESGLPANLTWQVTVGRISESYFTDGATDSLSFSEPSGTYAYQITNIAGWQQSNLSYSGTVVVSGAGVTEPTLVYTPVTYPVVFAESGLPSGLNWSVSVGGVPQHLTTDGGTDALTFLEPNGSYAYAVPGVPGWAQSTIPGTGSVAVSGAGVTKPTLVYTQVTYSVMFAESGLPSGLTWQVSVNSVVKSLTTNGATDSLTWTGLPNGTYPYSISGIAGWTQSTLAASGSIVVNGAAVTEPTLLYSKVTYAVVFTENGLPAGITWQVTLGRVAESVLTDGGADIISFSEGNGSYAYQLSVVSGWAQSTLPGTGTIVVNGASVAVADANYTQVTYAVVFTEAGLPGGTNWSVTLGASTENSTTPTIAFAVPNGTLPYSLGIVPGFVPTPSHGTLVISGVGASVGVAFSVKLYSVYFNETGLPTGTPWSVTMGSTVGSTSSSLSFREPNGTYPYTIGIVSGWVPGSDSGSVAVVGAGATVALTFTQVTYTVTFTEHGLPTRGPAMRWAVAFDGTSKNSTATSISFPVPNGTFTYLVRGPGRWEVAATLPPEGSMVVNGSDLAQSVTFLHGPTLTISAHEVGLAAGTHWCFTVGAPVCGSARTLSERNLTPGTYAYSIESFSGMTTVVTDKGLPVGTSGSIAVPPSTTFKVRYTFPFTITESGLPGSTLWKAAAGGQRVSSTSSTIVIYLTNGTYGFSIAHLVGYRVSPSIGHIVVAGGPVFVVVHFVHAAVLSAEPAAHVAAVPNRSAPNARFG